MDHQPYIYSTNRTEDFKDFTVKIDYSVTLQPKHTRAVFLVRGFETQCLVDAGDAGTLFSNISASIKYQLLDENIEPTFDCVTINKSNEIEYFKETSKFNEYECQEIDSDWSTKILREENYNTQLIKTTPILRDLSTNTIHSIHEKKYNFDITKTSDSSINTTKKSNRKNYIPFVKGSDSCVKTTIELNKSNQLKTIKVNEQRKQNLCDSNIKTNYYNSDLNSKTNECNSDSNINTNNYNNELNINAINDSNTTLIDSYIIINYNSDTDRKSNDCDSDSNINTNTNSVSSITTSCCDKQKLMTTGGADNCIAIKKSKASKKKITSKEKYCKFCNRYVQSQHHSDNNSGNIYVCSNCTTSFESKCQLKEHQICCIKCKHCKRQFTSSEEYNAHTDINPPSVFTCDVCCYTLDTKCSLERHKQIEHFKLEQCEHCDSIYESEVADLHSRKKDLRVCQNCTGVYITNCLYELHSKFCHLCKICEKVYVSMMGYQEHLEENELEFSCCEIQFKTLCEYNLHLKLHDSKATSEHYACTVCAFSAETTEMLDEHIKIHIGLKCEDCGKFFKSDRNLLHHMQIHRTNLSCDICKKIFHDTSRLRTHLHHHSMEKNLMCTVCGKTFKLPSQLNNHAASHTDERPYKCKFCDKSFKTKPSEIVHSKTHLGLKPYQCEVCGKHYSRKNALKIHLQVHTGMKPFECAICGKKYFRKDHLKLHLKTHTGQPEEKPNSKDFQCEACGKSFFTKPTLTVHLRTHTGEKPYECSECGKRFSQRTALVYHKLTHSGIKPFKCDTCAKAFGLKWQLVEHYRVHTGEKPYKCVICDVNFSVRSNYFRHSKIHRQ